jgi:hypothetical protein
MEFPATLVCEHLTFSNSVTSRDNNERQWFLVMNIILKRNTIIIKVYDGIQGRNFNEKMRVAEALLSFSCSLMVVYTRNPYSSKVTKIFGKYLIG